MTIIGVHAVLCPKRDSDMTEYIDLLLEYHLPMSNIGNMSLHIRKKIEDILCIATETLWITMNRSTVFNCINVGKITTHEELNDYVRQLLIGDHVGQC